jgi:hypothetical protein
MHNTTFQQALRFLQEWYKGITATDLLLCLYVRNMHSIRNDSLLNRQEFTKEPYSKQ